MMNVKQFAKGTVIFTEGQWEMCLYDIRSGKVAIYAAYGTPNQQLLTELEAGRYFGEMGLVDYMPRSATAVAVEDTETEVVDADHFEEYFKESPEKVTAILQNLSKRLRELSDQYTEACGAIAEYLDAEKAKKPGLLGKLKLYLVQSAEYAALAAAQNPGGVAMDHMLINHDFWI